ncbi:MAG: hypothetical protein CM15mV101_440 [uncultured marine virus]|nr:MAG: hypothetical protein CM15mV101_440 [uncultured marine virus]
MPKVVEFAELSEDGGEVLPNDYDNAGVEVDRRAKLYVDKKRQNHTQKLW